MISCDLNITIRRSERPVFASVEYNYMIDPVTSMPPHLDRMTNETAVRVYWNGYSPTALTAEVA